MYYNSFISKLLFILSKLPNHTKKKLNLSNNLKRFYYYEIGRWESPKKCFCGGIIRTNSWRRSEDDYSYEIYCEKCGVLIDED